MIESQFERELGLILKAIQVDLNGDILQSKHAFDVMVTGNMLGQKYNIDWDVDGPVKVRTILNINGEEHVDLVGKRVTCEQDGVETTITVSKVMAITNEIVGPKKKGSKWEHRFAIKEIVRIK